MIRKYEKYDKFILKLVLSLSEQATVTNGRRNSWKKSTQNGRLDEIHNHASQRKEWRS